MAKSHFITRAQVSTLADKLELREIAFEASSTKQGMGLVKMMRNSQGDCQRKLDRLGRKEMNFEEADELYALAKEEVRKRKEDRKALIKHRREVQKQVALEARDEMRFA